MKESELLAEMEAAWRAMERSGDDGGARTREEIERETGWPRLKVHAVIRGLVLSGKWEHVKVPRRMVNGSTRMTDAYRPVKP